MSTRRLVAGVALSLAALFAQGAYGEEAPSRTRISSGTLLGVRNGDTVAFKGIPYASPPVGELRWRAPQPVKAWNGVRPADKAGAICQQKKDAGTGPLPMSEDCLTLNVFAPSNARRAPVMVWIHGGGFVNGYSSAAMFDGAALARQGVVVVSINYRLGRFGFLAHPALTASAKDEPVANFALKDMIAALKWVRTNVAKFGGDPGQVTIFGESAGGVAVNDLMVSLAARGLFTRAVAESGNGREPAVPLAQAEQAGVKFATAAGVNNATAADLRKLSPAQIMAVGDFDATGGAIIDGRILTVAPMAGFAEGRQARVPYLVGSNSLEMPFPASMVTPQLMQGGMTPAKLDRIKASYPNPAAYEDGLVRDLGFAEPARQLARLHAARGNAAYLYQFSVINEGAPATIKGALHGAELPYVFNNLQEWITPTGPNDAVQARAISGYWTSFAKTGDPNGGGRPAWPAFRAEDGKIMEFTNNGPKLTDQPRATILDAIAATYQKP